MRFGYVPAPRTIYYGVQKLLPGTILRLSRDEPPKFITYWSLEDVARRGQGTRFQGTEEEAAEALDELLRDAVKRRMVADVPLGAFLSGGIDSSSVVALMQVQSPRPVRTFSIGFHEAGYDEGKHAAAVAKHLGTEHTELYASPKHALEVIPNLADMYDEPFADSSQIPRIWSRNDATARDRRALRRRGRRVVCWVYAVLQGSDCGAQSTPLRSRCAPLQPAGCVLYRRRLGPHLAD
jgi:asparagine synthase (glutamine-hydrolysing)